MPKVSVIITAYNYGKYLKQAIDSVLNQKFTDFELIIVDDASADNTSEILKDYRNDRRISVISHAVNQGLVVSCDEAIRKSSGEYVIRLDADDYLDENALLVLANILDTLPEVGIVYPDLFRISEDGNILEYERFPRLGEEVKLLDLPANGASTMFRRQCYEEVGGYDLDLRCQDGYDLWLKFLNQFKPYNVNLPLYYSRRHGNNLTTNVQQLLTTRRQIKQSFVAKRLKGARPKVLGLIPARSRDYCEYLAIRRLADRPLISYTVQEALKTPALDRVVFTTEDERIAQVARGEGAEVIMRPPELTRTAIENTVLYILNDLKKDGFRPDIVAVLHINCPFKKSEHIAEAIHTMSIFDVDSVVSIYRDFNLHYQHGPHGLTPLFSKRLLRLDREALYQENGAIFVTRAAVVTPERLLGEKVGHIEMLPEESIRIESEFSFWLAEQRVNRDRVKVEK